MSIRTLFLYLIGNRQAILDLAADRRSLWVGLLFVLSAAFAREYDGQFLLYEPWHLLIPVGASLGAATLLFLVVCGPLFVRREGRPPFFAVSRAFLSLFWLTAPLAWLYAVPYERFLSPGAATQANLLSLGLVAAWRVLLMIRVTSVLTGRSWIGSAMLVMLFADVVAVAAVIAMPKPIIDTMGGIRQTESEAAVAAVTLLVIMLGVLSAPVWAIGSLITLWRSRPNWTVGREPTECAPDARPLWALAAASLLVWPLILPWTQREQALRWHVEHTMKAGRIGEGLDELSSHRQAEFPPQWEPPPRVGYGEEKPHILDVMESLLDRDAAPWVHTVYVDKFRRYLGERHSFYIKHRSQELVRTVRVLRRLPEGRDLAAEHADTVQAVLQNSELEVSERDALNDLLILVGKKPVPAKSEPKK